MSTIEENQELFRAILAMDAYNRGYDAKLEIAGAGVGVGVGLATKTTDSIAAFTEPVNRAAEFYAIAYNWDGGTIISYRGTNAPGDIPDWATGLGAYDTDQTRLAAAFYRSVNGGSIAPNNAITLTGHSLGGGLAGFVASIYGVDAVMFDNMAFELAA